jgi:hypothetical protein
MYEQHIEAERTSQDQTSQQQPQQNQNLNSQNQVLQAGPLPNLQLPAARIRAQGGAIIAHAQGTPRQVPRGVGQNGEPMSGGAMSLQPNAALQAQMNVAKQQVLAAQHNQMLQQQQQQRDIASASSPASMHGTPLLRNEAGLPMVRGSTPNRVGSLQGGRPGVRASPNVTNAAPMGTSGLSLPPQMNMQQPNSTLAAQQLQHNQLQAQLQLAQVANAARAALQAYPGQGQGPPTNMTGPVPMNLPPGGQGLPPNGSAALPPQHMPNAGNFIPINTIEPTTIHNLIIPDVLTETALRPPEPAKFIGFTRASRLSLSNGLGASPSMAMPVYSARPPNIETLTAILNGRNGRNQALKGTLFDKPMNLDAKEDREQQGEMDQKVVLDDEDVNMSEPEKNSQASLDEVEEETMIHPRVKRRKLAQVAKLTKRDLTLSEGSEEVCSFFHRV